MASLLIVSGSPGTGKTTLSRALAHDARRGLHLASDGFYRFPARPVDPTSPAAQAQNETILTALGRAAGAFVEGGYDVFLDGVIGPWFLPRLLAGLAPGTTPEYVVLRASLDTSLTRVRRRDGPGASARVRHMHRAFADLGPLEVHAFDTTAASPTEIRGRVEARRAAGGLVLGAAAGLGPRG